MIGSWLAAWGVEAVLARLLVASVEGLVLAAIVAWVARRRPRLPAAALAALWWLVSAKMLLTLVWIAPLELPLLPARTAAASAPTAWVAATVLPATVAADSDSGGPGATVGLAEPAAARWPLLVVILWGLGVGVRSGAAWREWRRVRRLLGAAAPATDAALQGLFEELRRRVGVRRARLLLVAEGRSPLVVGLWRPRVLLPAACLADLSPRELALALAHELEHLRRRDLACGVVPGLARLLFFFHPVAALAAREYALAREAACDAAVLRRLGPRPEVYGRLLLRLGVGRSAFAAALGAGHRHALRRRLEMIDETIRTSSPRMSLVRRARAAAWIVPLAGLALLPLRLVAHPPPPPLPPLPAMAPLPPIPALPAVPVVAPAPPAPPAPPAVPAPPAPPAPVVAPVPPAPPAPPAALEEARAELARGQRELGERQEKLGEIHRRLAEEQRRLAEEQRRASERARAELEWLLGRAVAEGTAEPVGER